MNTLTILIYGNQIFPEIMKELKLFSKYSIKFYNDFNLFKKEAQNHNRLSIFFATKINKMDYKKLGKVYFPLIIIAEPPILKNILSDEFIERLVMPFSAFDLQTKVVSLLSKYNFKKSSLISLGSYMVDKNERKIKKDNLELQLTEKEINFLILFSESDKPLSRNLVLKKVWHYSSKSETHTIETHIHRLRKKILEKFNDNNFIKNNDKGYYI